MKDIILNKVKEIEEKENVKILYCVEIGSHAQGYASSYSDYDVRFVYIRPTEYYLSFDKKQDVIEYEFDDIYDICGWDIAKTLPLLYKSNINIFEWLQSTVVYYESEHWQSVRDICDKYFSSKNALYNYLNLAKQNVREYLSDTKVKLKKYFCILKPIFCCMWIMEYGTKPPFLFSDLYEKYSDGALKNTIENLLQVKINSNEVIYGNHYSIIDEFINEEILKVENFLANYENKNFHSIDELDRLFVDLLKKLWEF